MVAELVLSWMGVGQIRLLAAREPHAPALSVPVSFRFAYLAVLRVFGWLALRARSDRDKSVYTVNDTSAGADGGPGWGDLEETYLPAIGDNWVSQDLTSKYGVPVVQQYSSPVALYHTGFTSVYYAAGGTQNAAAARALVCDG
jgi:hypothetical protein